MSVPALPPVMVSPEIDAVTFGSIWNTRLASLPLTVTPPAGPVIVSRPGRVAQLELGAVRVIVCGVANTPLSKVIVWSPAFVIRLADASLAGCRRCRRRGCW